MTKIGIYGDSFGANSSGWPSFLQNFYKGSEIDNFARKGSSANFSYMRFLETHKKYDIVIFLWTSISRNSLIVRDFQNKKYNIGGFAISDYGERDIRYSIADDLIYNEKLKFEVPEFAKTDQKWVQFESFFAKKYPTKNFLENIAMRDSVRSRRPDSVNIECYFDWTLDRCGMGVISAYDWLQFSNNDQKDYCDDPEKRPNHLTLKQNEEFANYLYKHMEDKSFDIHSTFKNPGQHYTMSKTLEESGFIL